MKLLFNTIILLFCTQFYAQGCSDAGFCSIENTQNNIVKDSILKNSIAVAVGYGKGHDNINVINSYVQYDRIINNRFGVQAKLNFLNANGSLGNNSGLGDIILSGSYQLSQKKNYSIGFIGGLKIPLNNSNTKNNQGFALPLDYQTSLGTYDIIVGANVIWNKKWEINTGLQIPIIQDNNNSFFSYQYPSTTAFVSTNNFKRKSDALVRLGYLFQPGNSRFLIKPSLLAIYHLGKDKYTTETGNEMNINGSEGLTLNGVLTSVYTFKNNTKLEFVIAAPFQYREVRPDGLTRSLVVNLQYKIPF
ncbi:transporter [Flavobacterium sp. '19STA2R22 D10 B1']|uniref:transporter n=1 Tax=Flavobacterium aerium TaxID=3037261 RepID=UPI00278BC35C|nr:transporter [Flavobacterium sp. '19STA2R22 D10 B1']